MTNIISRWIKKDAEDIVNRAYDRIKTNKKGNLTKKMSRLLYIESTFYLLTLVIITIIMVRRPLQLFDIMVIALFFCSIPLVYHITYVKGYTKQLLEQQKTTLPEASDFT